MSKHVKNDSGGTDTWAAQMLVDAEIYEVQMIELEKWAIEALTSGSKLETDILSGDLKVSSDGFVTTLSAADGLDYMKGFNADFIRNVLVDDAERSDKRQLSYNATTNKIVYEHSVYSFLQDEEGDFLVDENLDFLTED